MAVTVKCESAEGTNGFFSFAGAEGLAQFEQPVPQNQTSPLAKPCPIVPTQDRRGAKDFIGVLRIGLPESSAIITGLKASPKLR